MPDGFITKSDRAPIFGMNSRDDPKDLIEGEVVELVNAEPGNPPIPRKGMRHWKIQDTVDFVYASHFVAFTTTGGTTYLVGWVKDGTDYKLLKINYTTKVPTVLGTATDLSTPAFNLIRVFDYIYSIVDEDMKWRGSGFTSRHKIIELDDSGDTVREMCINVSAAVSSISIVTGTIITQGFVGYAFTFIRHTASDAFDSSGVPQILGTFTPGVNESFENSGKRLVVGDASNSFDPTISLLNSATDTTYEQAVEFGATHIRVYRTRIASTSAIATSSLAAGDAFFTIDLPIPSHLPAKNIAGIELNSNDYKFTSVAHGLSAGNIMPFGFDNTELDAVVWPVTIDDVDTVQLAGSWQNSFDAYSGSGGYLTDTYQTIDSIDLTGAKVLVMFDSVHSLSASDTVFIEGITGGDGGDGEEYIFAIVTVGMNEKYVYKTAADHIGLNGSTYTVDSVFSTLGVYLTVTPDDYLKQFTPPTDDELEDLKVEHSAHTAIAYNYSDTDKTPEMSDGYLGSDLKAVTAVSAPENEVIVETTEVHNIIDGSNVVLDELTDGATELEDYSGPIELISTTRFRLTGKSTSGISPWNSGGTVQPASAALSWPDTVTDTVLGGELASIVTSGYFAAPKGGFSEYADSRFWLFGLLSEEVGRAIYSEKIGGAGGTPLTEAVQFPQKFASMFKSTYFIDFSVKKGYLPTGMKRMSNDMYFFFEGEVYALFTSDPLISTPTLVNGEIGCAFPETLKVCEIPLFGGQCLLYLSNLGPAITRQGGETFLFNDFKIKELWPKTNRELYEDLETNTNREHIIHNCSAVFHKNRYIISYENSDGDTKIFAYYFNPKSRENPNAERGPYQIVLSEV